MTAESQAPSRDQREADLLAHQRGLEGAVQAWHNDVIAEGHHTDRRTNETNIRALKARRTVLEEQITATRRALRAIRRDSKGVAHADSVGQSGRVPAGCGEHCSGRAGAGP